MVETPADNVALYVRRHLRFGWWSLLCFLLLGLLLETLWAFRTNWYVNEPYYMRRLVWTLAHAHGTLFAVLHIVFAMTLSILPGGLSRGSRIASPCLMGASLLMPGGFFLGGVFLYGDGGDPGLAIFLVPVGGVLLLVAVALTAINISSMKIRGPTESADDDDHTHDVSDES